MVILVVNSIFILSFIHSTKTYAEECFVDLEADRSELEIALSDCQDKIDENERKLQKFQASRTNTEFDILLIDQEINKAILRVRSSDVVLNKLGNDIGSISDTVESLNTELQDKQSLLNTLLQRINETEQIGVVNFLLTKISISSFFSRIDEYNTLRESVEDSIRSIESLSNRLEQNVGELQQKRIEQSLLRNQQQTTVNQVKQKREAKEEILQYQLAIEANTQEQINAFASRAGAIRNALFDLRGGGAIPFEEALKIAEDASRATGIRPAFLLGLLKHETNLGKNVGTGSYRTDMHPTRDQPIFPYIARLLQYDPEDLRVSANPGFGWGGAMGPAQFIPSTWVCFSGLINTQTNTCSKQVNIIKTTATLKVGSRGSDVKRLQQFLNEFGFTIASSGPGSKGNETLLYSENTERAVKKFQEKYANRILKPYGYTRGTGNVGPSTRAAVNELSFYSGPWHYKSSSDRVRKATRSDRPSNPYSPRDAFFASSLYLTDLGVNRDECTAARRYYAGGNWRSQVAKNYCLAVLSNARLIQRDIDFLNSG